MATTIEVTCRHCQARITPKKVKTYGPGVWILFAIMLVIGIFLFWPVFLFIWFPFGFYSHRHACPLCSLRLD